MTLPADEQLKRLAAAYGDLDQNWRLAQRQLRDARTANADRDAEIERLRAQIAALGTVTDADVEHAMWRVGLLFDVDNPKMRAALEAFVKTKGGGSCSASGNGFNVGSHTKTDGLPGQDTTLGISNVASAEGRGPSTTDPAPQSCDQACGADLHGRGKFGGPLAEQYVEQAAGAESDGSDPGLSHAAFYANAESDAAFVERIAQGYWRGNEENMQRIVDLMRAGVASKNPDPRDAQIAKLRETRAKAIEDVAKHFDKLPTGFGGDASREVAKYIRRIAARVLEETRGES